eukprot:scaffold22148_cov101-Isochrysis_galbana.AAC.2
MYAPRSTEVSEGTQRCAAARAAARSAAAAQLSCGRRRQTAPRSASHTRPTASAHVAVPPCPPAAAAQSSDGKSSRCRKETMHPRTARRTASARPSIPGRDSRQTRPSPLAAAPPPAGGGRTGAAECGSGCGAAESPPAPPVGRLVPGTGNRTTGRGSGSMSAASASSVARPERAGTSSADTRAPAGRVASPRGSSKSAWAFAHETSRLEICRPVDVATNRPPGSTCSVARWYSGRSGSNLSAEAVRTATRRGRGSLEKQTRALTGLPGRPKTRSGGGGSAESGGAAASAWAPAPVPIASPAPLHNAPGLSAPGCIPLAAPAAAPSAAPCPSPDPAATRGTTANVRGLPGFISTRSNIKMPRRCSISPRRSRDPIDTPPDVTSTWHPAASAVSSARSRAGSPSGTTPRSRGQAPTAATAASSAGRLES